MEQANRFLQRDVALRREKLGGRPFAVSERFTDAPPHLKFPNDVASWTLRYDGQNASVSREFDHRANMIVEGSYQVGLTAAQFVGLLAPGATKAMFREVATTYGKEAFRIKGRL